MTVVDVPLPLRYGSFTCLMAFLMFDSNRFRNVLFRQEWMVLLA